jgi:Putative sugar-binding domain
LIREWPNIQFAIVVNSDDLKDSNTVHRMLGAELAAYIHKNSASYFRQNDIIGIGSGRSVHHLVASFDPVPSQQFRVHNIRIMSLSGSMYPDARASGRQWFEADATAEMFARCFAYSPLVRTIAFPLVHADVDSVRRNTWLHDPEMPSRRYYRAFADNAYLKHIPTHAFIGVGVLNTDHRIYHEYSSQEQSTMLRPIRRELAKLIEISQIIQNRCRDIEPPYHPCGDICNRMFYVAPPDASLVREAERKALLRNMISVNDHVLTVTKTQLSMTTQQLVLISGTPQKAWTIRRLLEGRTVSDPKRKAVQLRFNLLCTDAETARFLLK